MVRIAVDAGQASQHSSNITASHQEIPSAASRVSVNGTAGTLGGQFFSKLRSHVDRVSSQIGQLQDDVARTVTTFDKAVSSQIEHDGSVQSTLGKLTSALGEPASPAPKTGTSRTRPV